MMLLTHIIIALASVMYASFTFFSPSNLRLRVSYGLIAGTFASGTLLVLNATAHMLETCVVGLAYIGFTLIATVSARRKLARASVRSK